MPDTEVPWYLKSYQEQFNSKGEQRLLSKIGAVIATQNADRQSHRDTKSIHPSDLSKNDWCPRATYYKITDAKVSNPDSFSMRRLNIFAEGNSIHEKWQKWMWMTGCLVGNWKCNRCDHRWMAKSPLVCPECAAVDISYKEVPIRDDEHMIIGHADGEWEDSQGRALVEIKGLDIATPLPTPTGWTTMADVQIGDELFDKEGQVCTVVRKSKPRKVQTYEVVFDDATTIVCDHDHLWHTMSGPAKYAKEAVLSSDIIGASIWYETGGIHPPQRQHRVPLAYPLQLPSAPLPVDPYVLGCWLGDGHCGAGSAHITNLPGDDGVFPSLEAAGVFLGNSLAKEGTPAVKRTVHGLITGLKVLGLDGVRSGDRWIPSEYLRGSYDQRLALLQGLLDTDGTWAGSGRNAAKFYSTSAALRDDVFELVASLGLRPRTTSHQVTGYGLTVTSHYVEFAVHDVVPFRVRRKLDAMNPGMHLKSKRRIIVEMKAGPDVWTQCVEVDSPSHTYLCGKQMVPTHNSVGLGTIRWDAPNLYEGYESGELSLDDLWKRIKRPLVPHRKQINLYLHCRKLSQAIVIYEWKPTQEVKEFHLSYDEALVKPMLDGAKSVMQSLKDGIAPPRPEEARKSGMCRFCEFKTDCWAAKS